MFNSFSSFWNLIVNISIVFLKYVLIFFFFFWCVIPFYISLFYFPQKCYSNLYVQAKQIDTFVLKKHCEEDDAHTEVYTGKKFHSLLFFT